MKWSGLVMLLIPFGVLFGEQPCEHRSCDSIPRKTSCGTGSTRGVDSDSVAADSAVCIESSPGERMSDTGWQVTVGSVLLFSLIGIVLLSNRN